MESSLAYYRTLGVLILLLAVSGTPAAAQQIQLGLFEGQADVGLVNHAGSTTYDPATQYYTLEGSGANMWFGADEFHIAWKRMSGNFLLRAHAELMGEGVDLHRKMGWIIRSSLDSSSAYVDVAVHGDGLTSMQFRRTSGADTEEVTASITEADVLQLEKQGNTYIMSVARSGDPFVSETLSEIDLGDEVYVGLFVCAHSADAVEKAVFRNVRIVVPPHEGYTPYRDYIGSNLEVMDVESGDRRILYQVDDSFQAPNWTPDGEALIYVHNGLLYRFDLARQRPDVIDTGFATRNNNDHVLSFDGRMLGISHHSEDHEGRSVIYTVPVEGGTPKLITQQGPSYFHGWSPDGKYLTYTAQRDGDYDVYVIPSEGGEEVRLTTAPGLDDGPEYSPDGQYIYFNSTRSGTMELWRMKPDGSDQEQLTDDAFNNWFPHISPDGEQILFISYGDDVEPDSHPFYKHVYLRLMPADGGTPRVVAYLYGGQGTINVPSWSPDGRQAAFVSNTAMQ
jgi:hypothetical protein